MNSELKILQALWDLGGEASFYSVAKTAGFSTDYARIVCRTLGQSEYVDWFGATLTLRPKGKLEVAKLKMDMSGKEKRLLKEEEEAEKEVSRISEKLLPHHRIDEAGNYGESRQPGEDFAKRSIRKKKNHLVLEY